MMPGMEQTKIPVADDWCTVAYAAEQLDVSQRQIMRYVSEGVLTAHQPRVGSRESARHKRVLSTAQVRELRNARVVMGRG
jgi:DNA-binding transcriptional MerR regulator